MTQAEDSSAPIVIIGAGHAGGSVAAFLRQYGHNGPIVLIGDEALPPYQRPPLSKAWLKGQADGDSLLLKPLEWYADQGVDLRLGVRVTSIDRVARRLHLNDGSSLFYRQLVLATGARPRALPIPGGELEGLHYLRSTRDAEGLKNCLGPACHLAIIGGGYVGLEVAASARALGARVTLLEREKRLLARVASPLLAEVFHQRHTAEGVQILTQVEVNRIEGLEGGYRLHLDDGTILDCDHILVGVGAIPNVELARDCGLECQNGIVVDGEARTSDPAIFALGDVSQRPLSHPPIKTRLESVPNALEQAKQVASAITGRKPPAPEVPWFWSDQYDLKLQIAGLIQAPDQSVLRGDLSQGSLAVFHMKHGAIQAVEAINAPAEFMGGRALIATQSPVCPIALADPGQSMKTLAAKPQIA